MSIFNTQFKAKLHDLAEIQRKAMPQLYAEFVKITPIDTGNARNNTTLNGNIIEANYPYAERLDEGWSKQAPNGMVEPTVELAQKIIPQIVKQIGNKR